MKRIIVGWLNKFTGESGNQVKTFRSEKEYREYRRKKMARHPDRAYGILPTGGSDG